MRRLLLLVVAITVYGSLYPWQFALSGHHEPVAALLHSWPAAWSRFVIRDVVINLTLYVPLGALACLVCLPRLQRLKAAVAATVFGFGLSLFMELLQNYAPGRTTSLSDLATNTIGAAAGACLALVLQQRLVSLVRRHATRASPGAVLLLGCWGSYQLYPFFPVFSSTHLRHALGSLIGTRALSPVGTWEAAAEWFATALSLEAVLGPCRAYWPAAAMLVLGLRMFMPSRSLSLDELAGAALAVLAWTALPAKSRVDSGIFLLLSAIPLAELAPFHFVAHATPFSWVPFAASFQYDRWAALLTLLRKSFLYGAPIWLLARSGVPYVLAGGALGASLFILEFLQRHLPGRTPEITDSTISVIMAAALWALSARRARRPASSGAVE